ncbi:MAG: tetratricopeptide repeat protein, partial [Cyanobacteria bacterium REEB65]|nr:tetratricopeptide repeat protein [Cyanobacteria bacterium REEB65]
ARLLALDSGNAEPGGLSPQQARTGAFIALDDIVVALARSRPLVLALEDLHWADEASLEWLAGLVQRLSTESGRLQLLVLCLTRSDPAALGEAGRLPGLQLALGPLPPAEVEALATLHLGVTPDNLSPPVQAAVRKAAERAEGNPFYLAEMLRALTDGGVLMRSGATWTLARSDEGILPTTVRGAVAARLDRLSPAARQGVQTAAVIGKHFDISLLHAIVGDDSKALGELVDQKLLYERPDGEVGFTQTLIHEVAYETLLLAHRRSLHRKVGMAIEQLSGDGSPALAPTLAQHFVKGEFAPKAAHYLSLAAEHARVAFANNEALALYQQALEWQDVADRDEPGGGSVPRAEISLQMALLETLIGDFDAAVSHLDAHDAMAGVSSRSLRARGDVHERRGNFTAARQSYQDARSLAGEDRLEAARTLSFEGNVLRRLGEFEAALALCRQAYPDLEAANQPAEAAFVHGVMGICYQRFNDSEGALREHTAALRLREEAGDLLGIANSHNNLGILDMSVGRWAEAFGHYGKALLMFRKLGDRPRLAMSLINLGDLLLKQGDDAMAERHFREAHKLASQVGDLGNSMIAQANLAEVFRTRGQGLEALKIIEECLAKMDESSHHAVAPELHLYRTRALMVQGEIAEAEKAATMTIEKAKAAGDPAFAGLVAHIRAEIALSKGDRAEALALAEQSLATLRDLGMPLELGRTLLLLARISPGTERSSYREEAVALFTQLGARKDLLAAQGIGAATSAN